MSLRAWTDNSEESPGFHLYYARTGEQVSRLWCRQLACTPDVGNVHRSRSGGDARPPDTR